MDVTVTEEGKATNVGQNYSLLPGDHIIVLPDERTHLERFVARTTKMN
jgi:hypothetical protein